MGFLLLARLGHRHTSQGQGRETSTISSLSAAARCHGCNAHPLAAISRGLSLAAIMTFQEEAKV